MFWQDTFRISSVSIGVSGIQFGTHPKTFSGQTAIEHAVGVVHASCDVPTIFLLILFTPDFFSWCHSVGASPKVNVIVRLELELTYYDGAVWHVSHNTMVTSPLNIPLMAMQQRFVLRWKKFLNLKKCWKCVRNLFLTFGVTRNFWFEINQRVKVFVLVWCFLLCNVPTSHPSLREFQLGTFHNYRQHFLNRSQYCMKENENGILRMQYITNTRHIYTNRNE